jgi:hypothetical protein
MSTHTVDGGGDDERRPVPMKVKSFDWIFNVAELKSACAAFQGFTELLAGDIVERQEDGKQFQVQPVAEGRPVNEPHDTYGLMVVTHTLEG